jgi:hypothetical protein
MKEKVILVKGRNIACPTLNSNFHPTSIIAWELPCHQLDKTESLLIAYKGGIVDSYHLGFTKGSIELQVSMFCN